MQIKKVVNDKNQRLSKLMADELKLNYNQIQKLIRNKDVKVQGKRISSDIEISVGNLVELYLNETKLKIIFENDDIIVVFKPRNLETVSEKGDGDLLARLSKQVNCEIFAVHRLDRNTEGLVIFAKNQKSKKSLDNAIKNRKIEKFYLAKVVGIPEKKQDNLIAYLKKDEKNSFVKISDTQGQGYEIIKTNYKLIGLEDDFSYLEVELITGKTHQIRAHLSHIGLPILGDEKYGNNEINKKFNKKYQCLCAFKLIFHFEKGDYLENLDGKIIKLNEDEIDFYKKH